MANDVSGITVTPTASDDGASVEYLDGSGTPIDDNDDNAAGQQMSLDVGDNTITVQVTAEDGSATESYTVTATRSSVITLVTNAHITAQRGRSQLGTFRNGSMGQRFTTGKHAAGNILSSVGIHIHRVRYSSDESLTVRVHECSESGTNNLGDQVATLTTPTFTAGELNYFDAPNTRLDPDTRYFLNLHNTGSNSMDLEIDPWATMASRASPPGPSRTP